MRNILKRALSLTLSLVMVFGLLGLGAAPKVHADAPTPITARWGCGAESPSYSYTFSSDAGVTSVTVTPDTIIPTEVSSTVYRYEGSEAATKAVIASDGLTFTFEGNSYIPHTGEVAEIKTSVFPASVSAKTVCVGQSVSVDAYYNSKIGGAKLVFSVSNGNVEVTGSTETGYSARGISAGPAEVTVKLVNASDESKVYATRTDTITVYQPTVTESSITLEPHNGDLFTLDYIPNDGLLATVTATGTYIDEAGLTLEATAPLAVSAPRYSADKTTATWTVGVGSVSSNGEDEFAVALFRNGSVLKREEFKIDNQAPTGQFKVAFDGTNAVIDVSGVSGATNYKVNRNAKTPEGGKITVPAAVGDTLELQAFDIHSNRFQSNPTIYDVTVKDPDPVKGTENGSAVYYKAANKADMALPVEVSNGVDPVAGVIPWVDGCTMSTDHKNIIWGSATEGVIPADLSGVTARYTPIGAEVTVPVTSALTKDQVLDVTKPTVTASAAKGIFYQTSSGYYLGVPSPNKQGTDTVTFVTEDNVLLATDIPEDDKTLTVSVSVTDSAVNRQDVAASSYTVIDAADNQSAGLILDGIDATKTAPVAKFTATPIVPAWASGLNPVDTDWHNEDINVSFTLNEGRDYTESDDGEPIPFANVEVTAKFNGSDVAVNGSGYGAFTATLPVAGIESDAVTFEVTVKTTCDRVKEAMYTTLTQTYKVDAKAPVVTAAIDGTASNAKYFDSTRTLTVEVADASSYTGALVYTKDGGADQTETIDASPFNFSFADDGAYVIKSLTVTDAHGNSTVLPLADITGDAAADFIIDKTDPTVSLSFDRNDQVNNGKYIAADDRTLTITVDDANIEDAAGGTVTYLDDTTETFGKDGLTTAFNADGTFGVKTVEVADLAGNTSTIEFTSNDASPTLTGNATVADGTVAPYEFVLDNTAPAIEVEFDNNSGEAHDSIYYFKASRTATVKITEDNFDPDAVTFTTTGTVADAWTDNGNEHSKTVVFDTDGAHTFSVSYTDPAGTESSPVAYASGTVSPESFTIDTVLPTVTATTTAGVFYSVLGNYFLGIPAPLEADDITLIGSGSDSVSFVTADVGSGIQTDLDDSKNPLAITIENKVATPASLDPAEIKVTDKAGNDSVALELTYEGGTYHAAAPVKVAPLVPAYPSDFSPTEDVYHAADFNVSFTLNEGEDYTDTSDMIIPASAVSVSAVLYIEGDEEHPIANIPVSGTYGGTYTGSIPVNGLQGADYVFKVTVRTQARGKNMVTIGKTSFKIDAVAPAVNAVIDGTAKNTKFFVGDRTLTVTVADMAGFTGVLSYSRDGVAQPAVYFIASPFEFTFSNEGVYEITALTVTDDHGNWSKLDETLADPSDSRYASFSITGDAPKAFIIDKTAPTAEVMVTCSGTETKNPADGQLYFDDDVTVTIKMTDLYVDPAEASVAWNTTAPDSSKSGPNDTTDTDGYVTERKFSITLTDAAADEATLGEQITEITGKLLDMAGNPVTVITPAANMADFSITGGSFSNADTFIVDKHAPKVEFTLPTTPAYSYNGVDYYSPAGTDKVQVVATVTDINFDPVTTLVTLDLQGTDSVSKTWAELDGQADFEFTGDGNAVNTLTYTIEDGVRFNSIKVEAHDKATNQTTDETASNPIVVDTTKPTVDLSVTALDGEGASVIEYFYLNESNPDVIHVVLKDKNIQEAGKESSLTDEGQAVTVTINVTDLNISYNPAVEEARRLRNDPALTGVWSGTEQVNTETTLTYTDSFTVKKDEAGKLVVDVTVTDLLGQTPETVTVSTNTGGADNDDLSLHPTFTVVPGAGGEIKKIFSLDRERSSSTDDHKKPVVTLTNSVAPITTATSSGGQSVPLYNQGFSYTVKANDNIPLDDFGDPVNKFAGLRSIEWTVTDPKGAVTGGGKMPADSEAYPDDTYEATVTMPITVLADGSKETNDATLRVTVTDNAGNQVYFVKPFAVDMLDPRVTIAYSNNASVRNNEYYNADRTLTITVDDLFFAGGTLTVNGANTALNNGVNTYAFTGPDTDYVVSITANDQVNHVTTGSEAGTTAQFTVTDGTTNPWKFTVDKVVPTINVTFNNNNAQNGHYYKDSRTATAMITERNFDAADAVYTATTGTSTLSAWTGANPHVATAVFDTDGDYAFTITFQDRAGNQAAPYTNPLFTIDLQDPEIEITGVEDYSANRGDLSPIVTFTDNNFKRGNDVATYSVKIEKVKGLDLSESEAVNLSSSTDEIENGVTLNYENLSKIRDNDGIYTLTATITDLSGRTVEKVVHYSLNRTGSTYYAVGDETIDLLKKVYSNKAPTVVIQEINPDELVSYNVTVSLNNGVAKLSEGTDFTAEKSGVQGSWKGVVYTINSSVFQSEGKLIEGSYTIVFDSEDKAGNLNSNRDNEVNVPVSFVLDETPPSLQINGIDEPRINADSIDATVLFQDGTAIARFEIYLNGELVRVIEGEELEQLTDSFIETIEKSNDWRVLRVKAIDVAGNESEIESIRFLVTTNALRLFVANPWLVGGAVALIAGGTTLGVVLGKKKKKDQDK